MSTIRKLPLGTRLAFMTLPGETILNVIQWRDEILIATTERVLILDKDETIREVAP